MRGRGQINWKKRPVFAASAGLRSVALGATRVSGERAPVRARAVAVTWVTSLNKDYLLEFSDASALVLSQLFCLEGGGSAVEAFLLRLPAAAVRN